MTKYEFDILIYKAYCAHFSSAPFGYRTADGSCYDLYFTNSEFERFVKEMEIRYPDAYRKYMDGKGSELLVRDEQGHMNPPKMASIASSSRFCYKALRDGAHALGGGKVEFEYECRIDGIRGTAPQMDAYSAEGNTFIEVKCHEIFDLHPIKLSNQYYGWLCEKSKGFGLALPKPEGKNQISIPFSFFDTDENCMLDIKQLLCHLMGVASKSNQEPATLVYLFFKPQLANAADQKQIDDIFSQLAVQIKAVFASLPIARFCNANNITLRAFAQNAPVMQSLTADNILTLY